MKRAFFVGLDLGMRHDFTALIVVERRETLGERDLATYEYRKIVKLPCKTAISIRPSASTSSKDKPVTGGPLVDQLQ